MTSVRDIFPEIDQLHDHRPTVLGRDGSPCRKCAEPWPCDVALIRAAISHLDRAQATITAALRRLADV
jgi:hypothetical protein